MLNSDEKVLTCGYTRGEKAVIQNQNVKHKIETKHVGFFSPFFLQTKLVRQRRGLGHETTGA